MLAYYGDRISEHMTETPEGFLICHDVPIARIGQQEYLAKELQLDGDPDRAIIVNRYPDDVFEAATLASFEGKDVTNGHPPENVSVENFSNYSKGHVENVRRSGDYIIADLHIKDAALIDQIKNNILREISCGYCCNYEQDGENYKQTHIRGNHVAVVPKGRAGAAVAIKDSFVEKGSQIMKAFWKSVLTAFGNAAKDASPEELEKMVDTTTVVLDAEPAKEDAPEAEPTKDDILLSKLEQIMEMLSSLMPKEEEKKLSDESDIDKAIEESGEALTIPVENMQEDKCSKDSATVELLKRMRPVVASLKDKQERANVVDALLHSVKDESVMKGIVAATQDGKKQSREEIQESIQAAYNARNPHKNKEEN